MRVDLGEQGSCLVFDGGHSIGAGDPAQRRVVVTRELDKGPGELRRVAALLAVQRLPPFNGVSLVRSA